MAVSLLASNGYRIAKSWQYEDNFPEPLPPPTSEDEEAVSGCGGGAGGGSGKLSSYCHDLAIL